MTTEQQKDEELWRVAKARVDFKRAFASYFLVNGFLTGIWFFTSGPDSHFWPIWSMLGWGLSLAFKYFNAYDGNQATSTQKEFEKLKNNNNLLKQFL